MLDVVGLLEQDLAISAIPCPGPVLVCPDKEEGHIQFRVRQELVDRAVQYALPVEPVVIICETVYSSLLCQIHLHSHRLDGRQVVEP